MHISCGGGGSDENNEKEREYTDLGQLSYVTFAWMVDLCQSYLSFDENYLQQLGKTHSKTVAELQTKMAKCKRHQGGWAQGMINDSFDTGMAAAGSRTRAPGQYDRKNKIVTDWSKLGKKSADYRTTHEYIHPSARIRINKRFAAVGKELVWERPTDQISLAGFQMKYDPNYAKDKHCSGLVWVKEDPAQEDSIIVPEWKINFSSDLKSHVAKNTVTPYFEHSLLMDDPVLQIVQNPESNHVKELPPGLGETWYANVWQSSYKFVLGKLPSAYHTWENE